VRVTSTSQYISMRDSLAASLSRVSAKQSELGTGRRINKASDDPVGSATALRYRSYETEQGAYDGAADNASTWLARADTQLQTLSSRLAEVRQVAIQANNGALTPEARSALGDQLLSLRDEVLGLANSQQEGQALFGGFQPAAVARDATGAWTFVGDGGKVQRRVGDGVVINANVDGRATFGFDQPAGQDLLSVIERLATHVVSGDPALLAADQTDLAGRTTAALGALGTVGATVNRVESAQARGRQFVEQITAERSSIEDIDYAEAILQLTSAQNGYQAALGAAARSNLPSLADFLH